MPSSERRTTRFLAVAAVLAAALVADTSVGAPQAAVPLEISGADAVASQIIEESIARYDDVGLALPTLRIHVHGTSEGCNGAGGVFRKGGDPHRIDLCGEIRAHLTVLHELAHAWARHYLSEDTKQAFLDDTGLTWTGADVPWRERGVEAVAITLAWGLVPDAPLRGEPSEDTAELLRHFELLTGKPSPRLA